MSGFKACGVALSSLPAGGTINKENNMTEEETFAIIYELAEQNALDPDNCEYDLQGEAQLQQEALNIGRKMLS